MTDHEAHLRLASVVKGVHARLRTEYRKNTSDFETLWDEHCKNDSLLSEYAEAMHSLATEHWANKQPETRIHWCRNVCKEYFYDGGLGKVLQKDTRRMEYQKVKHEQVDNLADEESSTGMSAVANPLLSLEHGANDGEPSGNEFDSEACSPAVGVGDSRNIEVAQEQLPLKTDDSIQDATDRYAAAIIGSYNMISHPFHGKMRLLDVGSCFNPFKEFNEFLAIGIDISPAVESVYHCDFLHLELSEPLQLARDTMDSYFNTLKDPIERLPRSSFHIVVFSLLLEYFPSPYQRWLCCQKAQELLMTNGLLLIITPDSHHQQKNAPMIKSWKLAIESMGFSRWKYIKQEHLHCMAFRKIVLEKKNDHLVSDITPDMMYIPQDFHDTVEQTEKEAFLHTPEEEDYLRDSFEELPGFDI